MPIYDVEVVVTRETAAVTQAGFGKPLILATSKDHPYTEYADLASLAVDFAEGTEEYKLANAIFAQTPRPPVVAVYGVLYDNALDTVDVLTTALNNLVDKNSDWYFLLCPEQGDAEVTALSGWVDAQEKLYFASTNSLSLPSTLASDRTALLCHTDPGSYPAEAWVGRCAPENPGSITWKFKTLNGILAADVGVTEINQLHQDGANTYIRKMGILQTSEGIVTSGEYIDIMRSQDWLTARMREAVSRLLITSPKVPYDNRGISMVVGEVSAVMKQGVENGVIAQDDDENGLWSISAPNREDIPVNDRANRLLPDIEWEATIAGAVHTVKISGVLKV